MYMRAQRLPLAALYGQSMSSSKDEESTFRLLTNFTEML